MSVDKNKDTPASSPLQHSSCPASPSALVPGDPPSADDAKSHLGQPHNGILLSPSPDAQTWDWEQIKVPKFRRIKKTSNVTSCQMGLHFYRMFVLYCSWIHFVWQVHSQVWFKLHYLRISSTWSWDLPSSLREMFVVLSLAARCKLSAILLLIVWICSCRRTFCLCSSSKRLSIFAISSYMIRKEINFHKKWANGKYDKISVAH